jgi:hypothetical protein
LAKHPAENGSSVRSAYSYNGRIVKLRRYQQADYQAADKHLDTRRPLLPE